MLTILSNKKEHVTQSDIARMYIKAPSFVDRLPWRDYNNKFKCFLLEDNESLGVCFNITPVACEARPQKMLEEIAKSISEAIKNSIPLEKENPWVLQVYVSRNADLKKSYEQVEKYFNNKNTANSFTNDFLKNLKEHFEYVSRQNGIFFDSQVTNLQFRGGITHVYAVLYRRIHVKQKKAISRRTHLEEIIRVSRKFSDQLRACGLQVKRMTADESYQWLASWFNPKHKNHDFSYQNENPIGHDFSEQLFFNAPQSFEEGWLFDGLPHKVLTIQNMTNNPEIGHISAERRRNIDDKIFNLVDHLPEDSVFVITMTLQAQSEVNLHLKKVENSAVGRHAQAVKVKSEIELAAKEIAHGNYLFPVLMAIYLKGENVDDLHAKEEQTEVLLNSNGFKVITDDEVFPIDAYLRYLPMSYNYYFDRQNAHRSRYMLLSDIGRLLPFYGRSRGTGNPGLVFFNRGGEPQFIDMMADRTKNAHLLLLGETGTGKSNLLNFLIAADIALYRSRFFIIDVGGSFNSLGDECKAHGLTVNKIKIDPKNPVSLNPFAHGLRIVDQLEAIKNENKEKFLNSLCEKLIKEPEDNRKDDNKTLDDEPRDILGDMVLAALIMITGGEKREEEAIRRSDRMLIMDAIIDAAYFVKGQNGTQMLASDIVSAFERLAMKLDVTRDKEKISRAREMADAMRYFANDPVSSSFFNSHGTPWQLADITIIDFGLFANEGYEAQRAIAFSSIMSNVQSLAELNQHNTHAIKVVCDENHIFTSIKLLAAIETRVIKTGRKLGLWMWIATQNMKDFPDEARRMLSQIEMWLCLALPLDEIDQIERFKKLDDEEREMFLSARKEKSKYTEGIFMGANRKFLFRNIPPRKYLVMAATEQHEKNYRRKIMQEFNCSEIEAINIIAKDMMKEKVEVQYDV